MGKWVHVLSDLDPVERTAICAACGPITIRRKKQPHGKHGWRCNKADRKSRTDATNRKRRPYLGDRKDYCEHPDCTATIQHPGQLDVHHIDGDHTNNARRNLQTLCANCHRLQHLLAA